ncbi:MAG: hypothetical protein L6428_15510 [Candidatus Aminicenantes bacterium]|nr:hypothetical protein [Candidatus Aminicenantes bacterium]
MNRVNLIIISIFAGLALQSGLAAPSRPLPSLFPELPGWQKQGKAETFLPETLYEHINGAAENFLGYDFEQLAVQNYENGQKQTMIAEIYFHGRLENAFGIYSSEKPLAGDYFPIGSQGYAEEGVLNFFCDAYYVKLNSFDLGRQGKAVLTALAENIAAAIGGKNVLPEMLAAFPAPGKIPHGERYILHNFLGHDFLHSAFTADYEQQGAKFQLFIIRAGSEENAAALLQKYAALDKKNPAPVVKPGLLTINDPYNGPIRLSWRGELIWGMVGPQAAADALLETMAEKLAKQ